MISRIHGEVLSRDIDRVEVLTPSGVVYEIHVPLSVFQRLPREGSAVELRTVPVIREDAHHLYGFLEAHERELFTRLTSVSGVGARLALAMMSTYASGRLAQALAEKDVRALTQVSGVGKKTAERIVLELADKVQDLAVTGARDDEESSGAREAVAALIGLGYTFADADAAVRLVIESEGPASTEELIRLALARRAPSHT